MPDVVVTETIAAIGRDQWDALFPGELEAFDYLSAVEAAGLPGFAFRYLLVVEGGRALAAAPAFVTDYALETTFGGDARRLARGLRRVAPGLMTQKLACLGSPCTETATIGFAGALTATERLVALRRLLGAFQAMAEALDCRLLGAKDVRGDQAALWAEAAPQYHELPGQPVASLDIDFADLDAYLARLSPGARKDMRRKLRSRGKVQVEVRDSLGPHLERGMALYAETLARAPTRFEELTPAFFEGVAQGMPGRTLFVLYFVGEDLLAFNLLLLDDGLLLDKFFCMEAARGRAHNLYYLSWFRNIELCLAAGIPRFQTGQASVDIKQRLGSRLAPTTMRFRHRNWALDRLLRLAAPLLADVPSRVAA